MSRFGSALGRVSWPNRSDWALLLAAKAKRPIATVADQ